MFFVFFLLSCSQFLGCYKGINIKILHFMMGAQILAIKYRHFYWKKSIPTEELVQILTWTLLDVLLDIYFFPKQVHGAHKQGI